MRKTTTKLTLNFSSFLFSTFWIKHMFFFKCNWLHFFHFMFHVYKKKSIVFLIWEGFIAKRSYASVAWKWTDCLVANITFVNKCIYVCMYAYNEQSNKSLRNADEYKKKCIEKYIYSYSFVKHCAIENEILLPAWDQVDQNSCIPTIICTCTRTYLHNILHKSMLYGCVYNCMELQYVNHGFLDNVY